MIIQITGWYLIIGFGALQSAMECASGSFSNSKSYSIIVSQSLGLHQWLVPWLSESLSLIQPVSSCKLNSYLFWPLESWVSEWIWLGQSMTHTHSHWLRLRVTALGEWLWVLVLLSQSVGAKVGLVEASHLLMSEAIPVDFGDRYTQFKLTFLLLLVRVVWLVPPVKNS